jgi:hypothetical protein
MSQAELKFQPVADEQFIKRLLTRSKIWTGDRSKPIEWATVWIGEPSKHSAHDFLITDHYEIPVCSSSRDRGLSIIIDHVLGIAQKRWIVAFHHTHPSTKTGQTNLTPSTADFVTFLYLDISMGRPLLYVISSAGRDYVTLMFKECHECPQSFFNYFIKKRKLAEAAQLGKTPMNLGIEEKTQKKIDDRIEVWSKINKTEWAAVLTGKNGNSAISDFFELPIFDLSRQQGLPTFIDHILRIDKEHHILGLIQSSSDGRLFPSSTDFATFVYMQMALKRDLKFVMCAPSGEKELYELQRCAACQLNSFFKNLPQHEKGLRKTQPEVKKWAR